MQRTLSIGWLALGLALATLTIKDLGSPYWTLSWLVFGVVSTVLALWTAASLFFGLRTRKVISIVAATCFALYWIYLFLIGPPSALDLYAIEGLAVLILALATAFSSLLRKQSS